MRGTPRRLPTTSSPRACKRSTTTPTPRRSHSPSTSLPTNVMTSTRRSRCDTAATTTKPFAVLCNLRSAIDQDKARALRDAGIPVLEGTETGVRAIGHLWRDVISRSAASPRRPRTASTRDEPSNGARASAAVRSARPARWSLLAAYGIPTVRCVEVDGLEQRARRRIGDRLARRVEDGGARGRAQDRSRRGAPRSGRRIGAAPGVPRHRRPGSARG